MEINSNPDLSREKGKGRLFKQKRRANYSFSLRLTQIRHSWINSLCMTGAYIEEWYSWHHSIVCTATENLGHNIQHFSALNILSHCFMQCGNDSYC